MTDTLDRVRELRALNDMVVKELQSDERPSVESVGIAWVCADSISEMLDDWERDLLSDLAATAVTEKTP